ncbi:hypothetical protein [Calothrix rhizosoleniae]|uniref:hypothetical protein n=1 Tax=Calothrix rhizosoleniae TaxID=888997 RepID=UPI000B49D219|nr:hypothetical protein [Calothrix rhizosoleniae]
MVGYLTGQKIHDLDSELYFAFKNDISAPDNTQLRPYTYAAKVKLVVSDGSGSIPGYGKQKVTFTDIR